jgi:hypothetical protein
MAGSAPALEPLKITCTSSDCGNNLHCFKATRKMLANNEGGACRSCGAQLINWERVHRMDPKDVVHTFECLRMELIRHHFWHIEIDQKALNHARRKGRLALKAATHARIRKSVRPANPPFDGRQTPREGNAIFYAQHATASCCRKCIDEWHGIPIGRELADSEVVYLVDLATLFIEERLPFLRDEGEHVAPIRPSRNVGELP